jgi:hypothetical protein
VAVRVSLQRPAPGPGAPAVHLASGALHDDDLVLVPNIDPSMLAGGPFVAVVVELAGLAPAPWELPGSSREDPEAAAGAGATPVTVHWVRCHCEEVHSDAGQSFQASFRLEVPCPADRLQVHVSSLLQTAQPDVWPEAAAVLDLVAQAVPAGFPAPGAAGTLVLHVGSFVTLRSSWCRFVPWC